MHFSSHTAALVVAIERHAQRLFAHREAIALLIELASQTQNQRTLEEVSFRAKFAHKIFGIMQRIGEDGQGFDQLSNEFNASVEKIRSQLDSLVAFSDEQTQTKFRSDFLSLNPAALQNFLTLLRDLSAYKNYRIDFPRP